MCCEIVAGRPQFLHLYRRPRGHYGCELKLNRSRAEVQHRMQSKLEAQYWKRERDRERYSIKSTVPDRSFPLNDHL